jgi:hypothetical protein
MDDFTLATLQDSRNEWCMQLVNILTPLVIEGFNSIFQESWKLCESNDEEDKYLMTFQNFIARVPKWNAEVITKETQRLLERSACNYMEDLLTCVHVIQLKVLTCIRVSKNQKKIDINIPKLDDFIHKLYIQVARKLYSNVYLYDKFVTPLQKQKHNREFEVIVQECILNAIRSSMPIEEILRSYLDETIEEDVEETIKEEEVPVEQEITENIESINNEDTSNTSETENVATTITENDLSTNQERKEISFDVDNTNIEDMNSLNVNERQNELSNTMEQITKLRNDNNETLIDDSSILEIKDDIDRNSLNVETIGGKMPENNDPPILNDIQILV